MIRLLVKAFLPIIAAVGWTSAAQSEALGPEAVVSTFHLAMGSGPDADNVEKIGRELGLNTVKLDMANGHVHHLEMVDPSGNLFLVAYGDKRDLGQGLQTNQGRILVTLYETDVTFFADLKRIARATLPDGPSHKLSSHDMPVEGVAWGADYPGVITLEVKYFADEAASQIEADWLLTN